MRVSVTISRSNGLRVVIFDQSGRRRIADRTDLLRSLEAEGSDDKAVVDAIRHRLGEFAFVNDWEASSLGETVYPVCVASLVEDDGTGRLVG
jgi:hypothetical protein